MQRRLEIEIWKDPRGGLKDKRNVSEDNNFEDIDLNIWIIDKTQFITHREDE